VLQDCVKRADEPTLAVSRLAIDVTLPASVSTGIAKTRLRQANSQTSEVSQLSMANRKLILVLCSADERKRGG